MAAEAKALQESASAGSAPSAPIVGVDAASRRPEVTWLRRTEYISSEFGKVAKKTLEASASGNVTIKHVREQVKLETPEDLVQVIEEGFEPIPLELLVHPTNPGLVAVESIPILPHAQSIGLVQCLFDTDPSAKHGLGEVDLKAGADASAVLRPMKGKEPNESFVWYYLRAQEQPEGSTESLAYVRDYDVQRNDKPNKSYALLVDDSGTSARYVPVTGQYHLKKRRMRAADAPRQPHVLKVRRVEQ